MSNAAAQESMYHMMIYLQLSLENRKNCKVCTIIFVKNMKISVAMKKWLSL